MDRPLLDRWTDTTVFRAALLFSGMAVLPVLALGVFVTFIGGSTMLMQRSAVELEQALFGLVNIGGALGFFGYARAHFAASNPVRHNLTLTLLCLAAGVAAAIAVAAYVAFATLDGFRSPWGSREWLLLGAPFTAANAVWAVSGIAWMQRLPQRYAEKTGRAFDTLPAMLLFVTLALATAAALMTTTL
jgi:hypothetical protein